MSRLILVIFLAVQIFQIGCHEPERERAEKLHKDDNLLSFEILALQSLAYSQVYGISEKIFNDLKPTLVKNLENRFPQCNRSYFEPSISEMQDKFTDMNPFLCQMELESIEDRLNQLLGQNIYLRQRFLKLRHNLDVHNLTEFENEFTKIQAKYEDIQDQAGKLNQSLQSYPWSNVHRCYKNLASQIEKGIAELRTANSNCELTNSSEGPISLVRSKLFGIIDNYDPPKSLNSPLEKETEVLWRGNRIIMAQILFASHNFHREMHDAAEQAFTILKPQINQQLQDHFPPCYDDFINNLMSDVGREILRSTPSPCQDSWDAVQNAIFQIREMSSNILTPTLQNLTSCIQRNETCDADGLYNRALNDTINIKSQLHKLQYEILPEESIIMKKCYNNVTSKVKAKIFQLTPYTTTCDPHEKYEDFLKHLSLWPFTLDVVTSGVSDTYTEIFVEPGTTEPPNTVSYAGWMENKWLRQQLLNLTLEMEDFLKYVGSKVEPLFNESYTEILRRFRVIQFEEELKKPPACYAAHTMDVGEQLKEYYKTRIYSKCMNPYPELTQNFQLIIQAHLSRMDSELIRDRDCRKTDTCQKVTSHMILIEDNLVTWKSFDFTNTLEFIKNCLNSANDVIEDNLNMDRHELRNCELVTFSNHMGQFLPINSETYPYMVVD